MPLDQRPLGDSQATNTSGRLKQEVEMGRVQRASIIGNMGWATEKPGEDFCPVPVRTVHLCMYVLYIFW